MLATAFMQAPRRRATTFFQRGLVRIEAVAVLVLFLTAVLAIVGLQTRSVQARTDAVLRAQAAQHAAELIAEMWTTAPGSRIRAFGSEQQGPRYAQWLRKLQSGPIALPGAIEHPPTVSVVQNQVDRGGVRWSVAEVTVTIYWQRRGTEIHQHVTTVRIPDPVT